MSSSTVPHGDITKALLIWGKAWESTDTRILIGSSLVGKWLGQLLTWMRVPWAIKVNAASGLELSADEAAHGPEF